MNIVRAVTFVIIVIAAGACGDDVDAVPDGSPFDGAVADRATGDRSMDVADGGASIDAHDNDVSNDAPGGDGRMDAGSDGRLDAVGEGQGGDSRLDGAVDDGSTDGDGHPLADARDDGLMDARSGDVAEAPMDVLGGDGSMDAAGDGPGDSGDGGCPIAGTSCSSADEGMACGQCPNPCAFCWIVRCSGGMWTGIEVPPLPPNLCRDGGDAGDGP